MIRTGGFTLLEILVVIVSIGVLTSAALLSTGTREPATAQEARRLAELLRLAAEEAVLQGQEWGLRLTNDGYQFMVLDEATWRVANDEILRPRRFPPGVEARLTLEGETFRIEPPPDLDPLHSDAPSHIDQEQDAQAITPQVLVLSSGEVSPFQLTFYAPTQPTWYVLGDYSGSFSALPLANNGD